MTRGALIDERPTLAGRHREVAFLADRGSHFQLRVSFSEQPRSEARRHVADPPRRQAVELDAIHFVLDRRFPNSDSQSLTCMDFTGTAGNRLLPSRQQPVYHRARLSQRLPTACAVSAGLSGDLRYQRNSAGRRHGARRPTQRIGQARSSPRTVVTACPLRRTRSPSSCTLRNPPRSESWRAMN